MNDVTDERPQARARLARFLRRHRAPRSQMFLLLVVAGTIGVAVSFALLKLRLEWMWLRYPLAGLAAYGAFLVLLRRWAEHQIARANIAFELEQHASESDAEVPARSGPDPGWLDWLNPLDLISDLDVGEFVLVIGAVALVVALVAILVLAPVILADVLLDGLLMAGLWRRFTRYGATESISGALRATYLPAVLAIVALGVLGLGLQMMVPGAHSIGDLFRHLEP